MNHPREATRSASLGLDAVLFILGGLVVLVPAAIPTDWDACQFVLGLYRFSPPDHQPHPPGYFFFLLVARTIQVLGADPHRALTLTSALAAALLPVAIRRLSVKLFPGRPDIALGSAILALAAPARLFFGAQALAYTWEGLLATILVSIALDLEPAGDDERPRKRSIYPVWLVWVAVWGIAGGFRPNLLLFFLPLALLLSRDRRWWENLPALLILVAVTALWLVPTSQASGGLTTYLLAVKGHSFYFLLEGLGWDRIVDNLAELSIMPSSVTGLHLFGWAALAILGGTLARRRKDGSAAFRPHQRRILQWVALPMILFHLFVFYTTRYSLLYVPLLLPLLAYLAALPFGSGTGRLHTGWVVPALICIASGLMFHLGHTPHSLNHLRSLERETRLVADITRDLGDPGRVTIVAGRRFRPWGMALEDYTVYHPMHALYPPELNPRLAVMRNRNTARGDFFLPGAEESENVLMVPTGQPRSDMVIILDEDTYRVLAPDQSGWTAVRITSRENLYWRRFPEGCLLVDREARLRLLPLGESDS